MTIKFHILFRACDKIESVHNAKRPFGLNKLEEAINTTPRDWTVSDWPDLRNMEIFNNE